MPIKTSDPLSFTNYYVEKRKTKRIFLREIAQLIDWGAVSNILAKYYPRGQSGQGRKAYPALVLLKMTLLQTWYKLSDYGIEEKVNDTFSFMCFCGLQLEDDVPDHSVVCRFRKVLNESGAWEVLLQQINKQLNRHGVLVKQGAIIDASVTPTLRKLKGKTSYTLEPEDQGPVQRSVQPGVDQQASWVKQGGQLQYGYKRHYLTDAQAGLVLSVHTTAANAHDSQYLDACLSQVSLPAGSRDGPTKVTFLRLMKPCSIVGDYVVVYSAKPTVKLLPSFAKRYNQLLGKVRYEIERVFGSIKRWFGGLTARYVGLLKTHGQHVLEALAYNLYRLLGIIMSNAQ